MVVLLQVFTVGWLTLLSVCLASLAEDEGGGIKITNPNGSAFKSLVLSHKRSYHESYGRVMTNYWISLPVTKTFTLTTVANVKISGIMAVIQEMNLVKTFDPFQPNRCHDYIEFSQVKGVNKSKKINGSFPRTSYAELHFDDRFLSRVKSRSFIDPKGFMNITYVSCFDIQQKYPFPQDIRKSIDVVFTAFTLCPNNSFPYGDSIWTPCSTTNSFSCIPTELKCDGVINCGFEEEFGIDEKFCPMASLEDESIDVVDKLNQEMEDYPDVSISLESSESIEDSINEKWFLKLKKNIEKDIEDNRSRFDHESRKGAISTAALFALIIAAIILTFYRCWFRMAVEDWHSKSNRNRRRNENNVPVVPAHVDNFENGFGEIENLGITTIKVSGDEPPSYEDLSKEELLPPSYASVIQIHSV